MVITMNESMEKLQSHLINELKSIFGAEISPKDKPIVERYISKYSQKKAKDYFNKEKEPRQIMDGITEWFDKLNKDSTTEWIFYLYLKESGLKFEYQYKIGPYRADFLLYGYVILEIDGPLHEKEKDQKRDRYLKKMGYQIIRISADCATIEPEIEIEIIKEKLRPIIKC